MRFGVKYYYQNPERWLQPWHELYARTLDQIVWADQAGFGLLTCAEHHFVADGFSPSLLPICAAVAARTTRIRIATYVLLLPFHHPLRVAEDGAVVDILSNGRFEL